jgi:hypothetical protein
MKSPIAQNVEASTSIQAALKLLKPHIHYDGAVNIPIIGLGTPVLIQKIIHLLASPQSTQSWESSATATTETEICVGLLENNDLFQLAVGTLRFIILQLSAEHDNLDQSLGVETEGTNYLSHSL